MQCTHWLLSWRRARAWPGRTAPIAGWHPLNMPRRTAPLCHWVQAVFTLIGELLHFKVSLDTCSFLCLPSAFQPLSSFACLFFSHFISFFIFRFLFLPSSYLSYVSFLLPDFFWSCPVLSLPFSFLYIFSCLPVFLTSFLFFIFVFFIISIPYTFYSISFFFCLFLSIRLPSIFFSLFITSVLSSSLHVSSFLCCLFLYPVISFPLHLFFCPFIFFFIVSFYPPLIVYIFFFLLYLPFCPYLSFHIYLLSF